MTPPVLVVVKVTAEVFSPLQTTSLGRWQINFSCRIDCYRKCLRRPSHILPPLLKCGVTTIVATTGAVPGLVATNEGISPLLPFAGNPIVG